MNHWIAVPILLPALTAAFLVLAIRYDLKRQRLFSVISTAALLIVAVGLLFVADEGRTLPYALGNWPAPFGIVLALDRLSALMVALAAGLALVVVLYACEGWDAKGRHFHALFQFQLMGICGAFLTGDVFNLFVFFEVMLIASYGLMLHGGGPRRLRAGFHYVATNLIGSTLFLFAVGLIYAVTGTLNMADLALRAATIEPADTALLRTGVVLLFLVFALKASLVPLHWWLPTAYAAAPAPTAALFAIMTKIGAYAIIRMHVMVFGEHAGAMAGAAQDWIVPAAVATLVLGSLGVLATRRLADLAAFAVVWSMGSLLLAIAVPGGAGVTAALYYAVHSTVAGAALFLTADLVARRRGTQADALVLARPGEQATLIGAIFLIAAVSMAGLPPLSGFIGKLFVLEAVRQVWAPWSWAAILLTSLFVIVGFARAGTLLFWKSETVVERAAPPQKFGAPALTLTVAPVAALLLATAALAAFAGSAAQFMEAAAAQITDVRGYVTGIMGADAALRVGR